MAESFGPFRDKAISYGHQRIQADVATELRRCAGTFHASTAAADAAVPRQMISDQHTVLSHAL